MGQTSKSFVEWYNTLEEPMRSQAIANFNKPTEDRQLQLTRELSQPRYLAEAIEKGFCFGCAPEGKEYWENVVKDAFEHAGFPTIREQLSSFEDKDIAAKAIANYDANLAMNSDAIRAEREKEVAPLRSMAMEVSFNPSQTSEGKDFWQNVYTQEQEKENTDITPTPEQKRELDILLREEAKAMLIANGAPGFMIKAILDGHFPDIADVPYTTDDGKELDSEKADDGIAEMLSAMFGTAGSDQPDDLKEEAPDDVMSELEKDMDDQSADSN